jgi:hypothetical protein
MGDDGATPALGTAQGGGFGASGRWRSARAGEAGRNNAVTCAASAELFSAGWHSLCLMAVQL